MLLAACTRSAQRGLLICCIPASSHFRVQGDALNSSLDESAFRSTTENELFPLPEAEPSLRDPAYEPTQQSSESAPATSLSPTLSRELPPSAPELSPRPAGSVPTFLTQEARPSSEIQPGLQVPVPATSASADPGVPARPALDPIQEPVQVVDATSRLPAGGLSGDDQAAVAGVETQGAGQGGEGEGAKEEGVVGGEGGPGSVETTAVAAEDVAPAGARVSDGDAELGELQLRQEAAVIKIQVGWCARMVVLTKVVVSVSETDILRPGVRAQVCPVNPDLQS